MSLPDQLVDVFRLLGRQLLEAEVVEDEEVWMQVLVLQRRTDFSSTVGATTTEIGE